ncbi:MAG TPA: hypothetical protein DD727_09610 [Clostridiales bacterium]|nr:hypothetical protein [Clostridiales bacterium]
MSAFRIAFVHEDRDYMERICLLLRGIRTLVPEVKAYTTGQAFLMEIPENRQYDMVLLGREMLPLLLQTIHTDRRCAWVLLEDEDGWDAAESKTGMFQQGLWHVGKYQESKAFLEHIEAILAAVPGEKPSFVSNPSLLVTVFSAGGGAGCSIVSYSLGRCLSSLGYRVLYLSLDAVQIGYDIRGTDPEKDSFERIGYHLKFRRPLTWSSLEKELEILPFGMKRFPVSRLFRSQNEMGKGELSRLLWLAKRTASLDFLIADIGCHWDERRLFLLQIAEAGILVQQDDLSHQMRTRRLEEELSRIVDLHCQTPVGSNFHMYRVLNHPWPDTRRENFGLRENSSRYDIELPNLQDLWGKVMAQQECLPVNPDSAMRWMLQPLARKLICLKEKREIN